MNRALYLLLICNINSVLAENSIIAIVNNIPITYNSINTVMSNVNSYESKIDIVNQRIDNILQLQKVRELNLEVSQQDVDLALLSVAETNNISIKELRAFSEFPSLEAEVSKKLSILNLQRFITEDLSIPEDKIITICFKENKDKSIKQIRISQIIISKVTLQSETEKDKNLAIKSFLKELSLHISKGASFESIAKLHSQHSSYKNGGTSDWIEVDNPTVKMLDSLKGNEISPIYLTDFGYAIGIKLDERFVSSNLTKCKEKLIYLNAEKFYSNWVTNLRKDAFIEIYHDKL